ncbi:MAG: hemolysin family protein, partial [Candidatus Aminicenantaceae bacterium]
LPQLIDSKFEKRVFSLFLHMHNLIYLLFKPFLLLFNIIVPKVEKERKVHEVSEEEIQAFINRAREEGIIEKDESALLRSVVEFGDTYVREIITPRVDIVCIERNETIKKIRNLVIQNKHSRIPVYRERIDNIEGIVLAKDLLEYSSDKWQNNSIESLIRPVHFVPESMKVTELLKELQKRKQKLAIVVDEHGGVSGLVTMEDLVEEIVGEIQDEYDKDDKSIQKEGPVSYIASGDVEIEEIEKLFNLVLEGNSYITLAGMITYHLGRLPRKGEHFEIKGLSLEILEIDKKRIKKLRIKPVVSQKE